MFRWKSNDAARCLTAEYATRKDFQRIFTENMADLHLLAFLLTADQDKADQCVVSGLEDSISGNPVFREWARSWSKRAIIKNAIKALAPAPGLSAPVETTNYQQTADPERDALISGVTDLDLFDRFVFVMTVLEGYSVHECSALLGCRPADVVPAKSRALQQLGGLQFVASASRGGSWMSFLVPRQTA